MTNVFDCIRIEKSASFTAFLLKLVEFLKQEGVFYVLERTSFPFVEDYLAAGSTTGQSFMAWIECLIRQIPRCFIRSMHMSMSVGKTTKALPSFNRGW